VSLMWVATTRWRLVVYFEEGHFHALSWKTKETRIAVASRVIVQRPLLISHLTNFLIRGNLFNTLIICPIRIET
jgi:hypothetical protein